MIRWVWALVGDAGNVRAGARASVRYMSLWSEGVGGYGMVSPPAEKRAAEKIFR